MRLGGLGVGDDGGENVSRNEGKVDRRWDFLGVWKNRVRVRKVGKVIEPFTLCTIGSIGFVYIRCMFTPTYILLPLLRCVVLIIISRCSFILPAIYPLSI